MSSSPATTAPSPAYRLTLTPAAMDAGGQRTAQTPGEFLASCDHVLREVMGVAVTSGTVRDSEVDTLPASMVQVRSLPSLEVQFAEVSLPYSVALGSQVAREDLDVDGFVAGLAAALSVVWGQRVRVYLERRNGPVDVTPGWVHN